MVADQSYPTKPTHSRSDTALHHGLSTSQFQELKETCIEAKSKAYCKDSLFLVSARLTQSKTWFSNPELLGPYSNFRVGASVLIRSGSVIQGANIENASYPVGTCAERVALGNAVFQVHWATMNSVILTKTWFTDLQMINGGTNGWHPRYSNSHWRQYAVKPLRNVSTIHQRILRGQHSNHNVWQGLELWNNDHQSAFTNGIWTKSVKAEWR